MIFFKDCKRIARSMTYLIYCVIIALFFFTQYFSDCRTEVGPPFGETKAVEDHDLIMSGAALSLAEDYFANFYICYPFGFYKSVTLNEKKQEVIEDALTEMTGLSMEELTKLRDNAEHYTSYDGLHEYNGYIIDSVPVSSSLTYDRFLEIMKKVNKTLGGGSSYKPDNLIFKFSQVPMTKEEALEEYDNFTNKDRVTGALARLFSDYSGIDAAILPVFVAAALTSEDRRRRMSDLVYSRKISSFRLVFTRYAALITAMFIPLLITMIIAQIQAVSIYGSNISMTALFTLPSFWLVPNIMEAAAVGMLFTELFSGGTAVIVQFLSWFLSLLTGSGQLYGKIRSFTLICRHNTVFGRDIFMTYHSQFVFNRIFYIVFSLAMVTLTVFVYETKRRGAFNGIRLFGKGSLLRRKA